MQFMAQLQPHWARIRQELLAKLDSTSLSLIELSERAQINYHALRRMRRGGLRKRTANALAICSYFGIDARPQARKSEELLAELHAEIERTWDGSEEHALLLKQLLLSTKDFKVSRRAD
jgi:hypothetical protein